MDTINIILGASAKAFRETYPNVKIRDKVLLDATDMLIKVKKARVKINTDALITEFCNIVACYLYGEGVDITQQLGEYIERTKKYYKQIRQKLRR